MVFTEGETAYLNEELVAQVEDPDDHGGTLGEPYEGVHIVSWQWYKADGTERDDTDNTIITGFVEIPDETTNRYTPNEDDRGHYLQVTATYTDPHSGADVVDTTQIDERVADDSLITESATTENAVRLAPGPASAPMFSSASATRSIAENSGPGTSVGSPVTASGPEGITYSLEGPDAKYFNIAAMDVAADPSINNSRALSAGQITVGGDDPATTDNQRSELRPTLRRAKTLSWTLTTPPRSRRSASPSWPRARTTRPPGSR